MKKVVGYCRVSTDGQVGEDKFGLPVQKEMIQKYCDAHDMEITEWYIDEGKSGAYEEGRNALNSIVYGTDVTNPPIHCVVTAKSDRIARDIKLYYYYKHMMYKKEIELISVSEDFGDMGVFAPILEAFVVVLAEQERNNITIRTSGGRNMKAKQGGYSGGRPPYGYYVSNKQLLINEEEAEVVRFIFAQRDNGATIREVVKQVNESGYRTRSGKDFLISTVQSVLDNRKLYEGFYQYGNNEMVEGNHEAILK